MSAYRKRSRRLHPIGFTDFDYSATAALYSTNIAVTKIPERYILGNITNRETWV